MPRLFGEAVTRAVDANGDPVSGALLTVYLAGTTTSVTTYQDSSLSTAHASPVVADSSGVFAAIYLEPGAYKVDITDSEGTSLGGYPVDNVLVSPEALAAFFDTYSDAETASVSADTKTLKLNGYTSAGDGGGAAYTRVDSEPSHAAKLRTSDRAISDGTTDATNGGWWEIVPDPGGIRPQQLGAAGDGSTDDTTAFNNALAYAKDQTVPLYIPAGDYLLGALDTIIDDVSGGPTVDAQHVVIRGAGRELTRLIYSGNLATPLLDCSPDSLVKQGSITLSDLTIDGDGNTGVALKLEHMLNSTVTRVKVEDVAGLVFNLKECWDSNFTDILADGCGSTSLPVWSLDNRDRTDGNTSCNNLFFNDVHCENSAGVSMGIYATARKLTFQNCKFHHDPSAPPAYDHVVIDGLNASGGVGYMVSFLGCHFAQCGASAIVAQNTGGTAGSGFLGIMVSGCSFRGITNYGIELLNTQSASVSNSVFDDCDKGGVLRNTDAYGVGIDFNTVFNGPNGAVSFVRVFDGSGRTSAEKLYEEIIEDGSGVGYITALGGDIINVDTEGETGTTDDLDGIKGGFHGMTITLKAQDGGRTIVAKSGVTAAGNNKLYLNGGADRTLDNGLDTLTLRYSELTTNKGWYEIGFSSNGT